MITKKEKRITLIKKFLTRNDDRLWMIPDAVKHFEWMIETIEEMMSQTGQSEMIMRKALSKLEKLK